MRDALAARFWGGGRVRLERGLSRVVNVSATAAAPTKIFPENPNRVAWQLSNFSANRGHIDWDPSLSTSDGFLLEQSGGAMESSYERDGETVQQSVWAIMETGASDVTRRGWEIW